MCEECLPTETIKCNNGHSFCIDCIRQGVEELINDGKSTISCFTECNSEIEIEKLELILEPKMYKILFKNRQLDDIRKAKLQGLEICPYCNYSYIPPIEDKIFRCKFPECLKETCRYICSFN